MTDKNDILINRVAQSGLITLNLENHFPRAEMVTFDIKDHLWQGLILKEKDFRQALKEINWEDYSGKILLVVCTADAIVPMWAYMLISAYAAPYVKDVFAGDQTEYLKAHYYQLIKGMDMEPYRDGKIVIKGCGDQPVPAEAYLQLTERLRVVASSIMYGEPCSTVPIFKAPRTVKK